MRSTGRWPVIIVLIVAFIASAGLRHMAATMRGDHDPARGSGGGGVPLSRMNSYALALLLGGLRGPLVMILWPSSEGQKSEKNVEDLDTKIEWIRLLQAEFDSVHIFQIWNKAYNISVLMANLPNKYATILDALDYAYSVDRERPNNVNIIYAIGHLYFDKLGTSAEKRYYRARVRAETQARQPMMRVTFPVERRSELVELARAAGASERRMRFVADRSKGTFSVTMRKTLAEQLRPKFNGDRVSWEDRRIVPRDRREATRQRTELDPMLDDDGNILPQLLEPRPHLAAASPEGNDGSELQYLKRYEPFPYGISTIGLAYNYFMRTQSLLRHNNQHHAQMSDLVIDSRPALALRDWSDENWELARLAELEALGLPIPTNLDDIDWRLNLEPLAAHVELDRNVASPTSLEEARFLYQRSARIAMDSIAEYQKHLEKFKQNIQIYQSHMDALTAQANMMRGDEAFLAILVSPQDQRAALARQAIDWYTQSARQYMLHILKYYTTPQQKQALFGQVPDNATLDDLLKQDPARIEQAAGAVVAEAQRLGVQAEHWDEVREYAQYVARARARLGTLSPLAAATAGAR